MTVAVLPGVLTVPEAARHAGVSPQTIRREVKAGRLRARYIGRLPRILDEDLGAWLRADSSSAGRAVSSTTTKHPAGGELGSVGHFEKMVDPYEEGRTRRSTSQIEDAGGAVAS